MLTTVAGRWRNFCFVNGDGEKVLLILAEG